MSNSGVPTKASTVSELIEKLKEFPPNATVTIQSTGGVEDNLYADLIKLENGEVKII